MHPDCWLTEEAAMRSRDRVLATLNHEELDRVPHNLRLTPELAERLHTEVGHDVHWVSLRLPERPEEVPKAEWTPKATEHDAVICGLQHVSEGHGRIEHALFLGTS